MDVVLHCSQHRKDNAICTDLKRPQGHKAACQDINARFIANFVPGPKDTKREGEKGNLKLGFSTVSLCIKGIENIVIYSKLSATQT